MKYKFILTMMAMFFAINMNAQQESNYPHAFIGVQGGVMRAYNGEGIDRKWSPMAALNIGYNFTQVFGLRLQANGSTWKAELPGGDEYKSKIGNIDLDMMFNLSNVFFPNRNNLVNVIAIAGAPFNLAVPHSWVDNYAYSISEGGDRWNTAWKVGGQLDFNIAKHWGFNLEAGTNYVRQKNEGLHDNNKWWPYAMAGITYKFGFKKAKKAAPVAPVVAEPVQEPKAEPAPQPKREEPKPAPQPKKEEPKPVVKPAKVAENIFFELAKSDVKDVQNSKIDAIVKFANENPNAKISLVGYADKGTGTTAINKRLSDQRVKNVKDILVKKGIKASRISTESKGDTVQPFANNDDNRVVIVVGE